MHRIYNQKKWSFLEFDDPYICFEYNTLSYSSKIKWDIIYDLQELDTLDIMRDTWIVDINWKKVYEGDICKMDVWWNWKLQIETFPKIWPQSYHRYWELQSLIDDNYYIEVVWNIYNFPMDIEEIRNFNKKAYD